MARRRPCAICISLRTARLDIARSRAGHLAIYVERAVKRIADMAAHEHLSAQCQQALFNVEVGGAVAETGKRRHAYWKQGTLNRFNSAIMLLSKVHSGPIDRLCQDHLVQLNDIFDRLPTSHHKSKRHKNMSLEEIAAEAARKLAQGEITEGQIGSLSAQRRALDLKGKLAFGAPRGNPFRSISGHRQ
jgi:hypothetical protein